MRFKKFELENIFITLYTCFDVIKFLLPMFYVAQTSTILFTNSGALSSQSYTFYSELSQTGGFPF